MATIKWETLQKDIVHGSGDTSQIVDRSRVPGGWLVRCNSAKTGIGLTFVPDPHYTWK